jgi:hypothetical protein
VLVVKVKLFIGARKKRNCAHQMLVKFTPVAHILFQIKALQEKNRQNNLLFSDYVLADNSKQSEERDEKKSKLMPEASAVVASKDAQTTTTTTKKDDASTTTAAPDTPEKVF